jgi:hypothetical protein
MENTPSEQITTKPEHDTVEVSENQAEQETVQTTYHKIDSPLLKDLFDNPKERSHPIPSLF